MIILIGAAKTEYFFLAVDSDSEAILDSGDSLKKVIESRFPDVEVLEGLSSLVVHSALTGDHSELTLYPEEDEELTEKINELDSKCFGKATYYQDGEDTLFLFH